MEKTVYLVAEVDSQDKPIAFFGLTTTLTGQLVTELKDATVFTDKGEAKVTAATIQTNNRDKDISVVKGTQKIVLDE